MEKRKHCHSSKYKRDRVDELSAHNRKRRQCTRAGRTAADKVDCNKKGEKRQTRQYAGNCSRRGCKIGGFFIRTVYEQDSPILSRSPPLLSRGSESGRFQMNRADALVGLGKKGIRGATPAGSLGFVCVGAMSDFTPRALFHVHYAGDVTNME